MVLPLADRARTNNLHLDCGQTDTNNSNQHRNSVCCHKQEQGGSGMWREGGKLAKAGKSKDGGNFFSTRGVKPRTADRTGTRSCAELEKMMLS
jgi:hypothetical protein